MRVLRRRHGTTLVELLVACVFLGICVTAMVTAVTTSTKRSEVARNRMVAIALADDMIQAARAEARKGTLSEGFTSDTRADTAIPASLDVMKMVSKVDGFSDLYRVSVYIGWNTDPYVVRADNFHSVELETLVRSPDA